ncbi:MAG: ABC transporter ATP-binding protein [Deltaproteobacteria bacterium]|nr:ABC transporter ATP-binding protein [Deltaproteobacteria bacterium]
MPLIELKNISKVYRLGSEDVIALNNVNLVIERGEFISIIGPSGSGKSTLMHILGCLESPSDGEYYFDGINVRDFKDAELAYLRNRRIGFVFQNYNLLPQYNVLSNVALPLLYSGVDGREREKRAIEALKSANLTHRNRHRPSELSGGERQRVAIARAIVNSPDILLADEPTGNLDQKVGKEIISLFQNLNKEKGVTVVLVTHDLNVANVARRIIRILDGRIIEDKENSCGSI